MLLTHEVTILLLVLLIGVVSGLECYSCRGARRAGDSQRCLYAGINSTSATPTAACNQDQTFCKKKIVQAAGDYVVERHCAQMCSQQTGIVMAKEIYIDTFCCHTDLCNQAGTSQPSFATLLTSLTFFLLSKFYHLPLVPP